jgi:hypothetical protein
MLFSLARICAARPSFCVLAFLFELYTAAPNAPAPATAPAKENLDDLLNAALEKPKAEEEAAARAQQEAASAEAKKQAETEAKARQTEENKAKAEVAIDRAIKTREGDRPEMVGEGGQRVVQQTAEVSAPITQETPTVDSFVQKRQQQADAQKQAELQQLSLVKQAKEEELARKQNALKAAQLAASGAGTLETSPNVAKAQEAVDMAQQDLESINQSIKETSTGTSDAIKESISALESPMDLIAQMATAALQSGSIYTHDTGLIEQLGLLNETMANFVAIPTTDPGFIVSDVKVLEALNNLQAPFAILEQMATASLAEGINTKDVALASIIGTVKPAIDVVSASVNALLAPINGITTILGPILDGIAAPIKGIAKYFGVELSTNQALGTARGLATGGIPGAVVGYAAGTALDATQKPQENQSPSTATQPINRLELANTNSVSRQVISAPVPVTMPAQAQATNQNVTNATTPTPTETSVINISPESLKGLETFNTNFATYVDKLVAFEFPTIPEVIEMKGNHVVDVRISGAAAFEGLKKDFETMMQKEIKKAMGKIWGQSGGQMGSRPDGE